MDQAGVEPSKGPQLPVGIRGSLGICRYIWERCGEAPVVFGKYATGFLTCISNWVLLEPLC